jgi:serine-type D-Ala-D-Ala carboxypeptidase (penicillin-binding protein 5/6)
VGPRLGALLLAALSALLLLGPGTALARRPPRIEARAWALIDARTGEVLTSHAAARHLLIASTTKLMTAWVALHELPLGRIVRAAPYHATYGESLLGLRPGQRISVRDLLYGMVLVSGNDAAYDLALAAAGSEKRFVRQMNGQVAALGLPDTHYANPIGLDERGNYSSARDLTTLAQDLLRIPAFARIADSRSTVLRSLRPPRRIVSINELLRMAPWVNGVKTGHTFGAGFVLVGSGRRKGVELISAAIGAPTDEDRFDDNLDLLDYGFSLYRRQTAVRAGQALADPAIRYAGGELPLISPRAVKVAVRHGQRLSVAVRAPKEVQGPIRGGAVLGRAKVLLDGLRVATVPLRAGRSIPRASAFEKARSFASANAILLVPAAFVILIGAAFLRRRRRRGGDGEERALVSREEMRAAGDRSREGGLAG